MSHSKQEEYLPNNPDDFDLLWEIGKGSDDDGAQELETPVARHTEGDFRVAREKVEDLQSKLKERDLENQRIQWQLAEREKELRNLYIEVNNLLELNQKLNKQFTKFQDLKTEYLSLKEFSKNLSEKL